VGTILLSAGGTGGHVLPALLVAEAIREKKPEVRIVFLGVGTNIESRLLSNSGFGYVVLKSQGVVGGGLVAKFRALLAHISNYSTIKTILGDNDVVSILGFGGYPSFMPLLVGKVMGLKTSLFEQNGRAGLANKVASLFVDRVFSVPYSEGLFSRKITYILNPVRKELRDLGSIRKDSQFKNILILGGSQGAVGMSTLLVELFRRINRADISILHQTGAKDHERVNSLYEGIVSQVRAVSYIDDMKSAYENADLVIARAGAGTYGEILAVEKPCIFIPLPISRGHQYYNVKHLAEAGGAFVVKQDSSDALSTLESLVSELLDSKVKSELVVDRLKTFKQRASANEGELMLSEYLLKD